MRTMSSFARKVVENLRLKQTHLAIFRMWLDEQPSPECRPVLETLIANTSQMVDALVQALRREGVAVPSPEPNPALIKEARKPPHSRARLHYAEQLLRRSLAWYEERLDEASPEERPLWERLFALETENWARVEDMLTP